MRFRKNKRHRGAVHLNLIPLTDCALILLIFYALSVNFGASSGIKVKLPQATAEALQKEKKELNIGISKDGTISVEGKTITLDELAIKFKELYKVNPAAAVIIQGDEEAHHGRIVQVMDRAKGAGLNKLAIATRPAER